MKLTNEEIKNLPKSTIKRLQIQRGGSLEDLDWNKIGKERSLKILQDCREQLNNMTDEEIQNRLIEKGLI